MAEVDKTTRKQQAQGLYEECMETVGLRRRSGEFEGRPYTTYYLTIGKDVRIKVTLDPDKRSLMNKYLPFVPVVEEVGVE